MNNNAKGFSAIALIAVLAAVIIAGIAYYVVVSTPAEERVITDEGESMIEETAMEDAGATTEEQAIETKKDEESAMEDGTMQDQELQFSGVVIAGSSAPLFDFNQSDYEKAAASDKLVVLYFYANWCPICKDEVANALYPAFNELSRSDVVGFRVNYNDNQTDDDERELAREFGVAYQHTKVFVKNGERVLKSPEQWDKERYADEIERAI